MELIICPQLFRIVPFSFVHTYTGKQRFQKVPLWRAFSKKSVFIDRFHGIRADGSRIRKEKVAFFSGQGLKAFSIIPHDKAMVNSFSKEIGILRTSRFSRNKGPKKN